MALVDHDEVEEVGRKLPENVEIVFGPGDGLVEGEVDFELLLGLAVADFGHHLAEGRKVVRLGLVDQDGTIGQKENALFDPGLPEPPDNLKGGVGLAGARRHHEQEALLPPGHRLDRAVDGVHLVVVRRLARRGGVVGLLDHGLGGGQKALPGAVAPPKLVRGRKLIETHLALDLRRLPAAIVKEKPVAVRSERKGHVEHLGVVERLLHAGAEAMLVVFGLDDRDRQVRPVVEHVVGAAPPRSRAGFAPRQHPPSGKLDLFANLGLHVPACSHECGRDELRADVSLRECLFVHGTTRVEPFLAGYYPSVAYWEPEKVRFVNRLSRRKR
ncbi:MAG: hypothetical protein MUF34_21735 [Polyangiaceae bacterium]|nr:hypothetical protein [Polyangiaceae bacterium]